MPTFQDRLKQFLEYLNIPMQAFERQCGIAQGLGVRLSEKSYSTTFRRISDAFPELDLDWLKTGRGEMLKVTSPTLSGNDFTIAVPDQVKHRDVFNLLDAKKQIMLLQERIKLLEAELRGKSKELDDTEFRNTELSFSLQRERKMNDLIIGQIEQLKTQLADKERIIQLLEQKL